MYVLLHAMHNHNTITTTNLKNHNVFLDLGFHNVIFGLPVE